jgi:hypothetical protein
MPEHFVQKNDREEEFPAEAYRKAMKILEEGDDAIDPARFSRFDQGLIRADQYRVEKRKAELKAQRTLRDLEIKRQADVFEVMFAHQVELNDWLGPDTMIRRASEYDDLFNGIDSIAEFSKDEGATIFLALGIDVTSSEEGVEKKLTRIKRSIDEGRLDEIRYFQSFFSDGSLRFEGSLFNVPKGIVAIDRGTIAELAKLWVKKENKTLAHHPIQYVILEQLELQMETFLAYAKRKGKKNIAAPLMEVLARIKDIKRIKQGPGPVKRTSLLESDRMVQRLKSDLKSMFGEEGGVTAPGGVSVMRKVA